MPKPTRAEIESAVTKLMCMAADGEDAERAAVSLAVVEMIDSLIERVTETNDEDVRMAAQSMRIRAYEREIERLRKDIQGFSDAVERIYDEAQAECRPRRIIELTERIKGAPRIVVNDRERVREWWINPTVRMMRVAEVKK